MDLFKHELTSPVSILPHDGEVWYTAHFFGPIQSANYFQRLYDELDWQRDELLMFGKRIITKRMVTWYGDSELSYTYSKIERKAKPWPAVLWEIKEYLEKSTQTTFNSCLGNLYHNGEEGMSWHSDDEPELKHNGSIASLSFGAIRQFQFKHQRDQTKIALELLPGSLLMMQGATQQHWKHQLPVSKKVGSPRINLTFRTIVPNQKNSKR